MFLFGFGKGQNYGIFFCNSDGNGYPSLVLGAAAKPPLKLKKIAVDVATREIARIG